MTAPSMRIAELAKRAGVNSRRCVTTDVSGTRSRTWPVGVAVSAVRWVIARCWLGPVEAEPVDAR